MRRRLHGLSPFASDADPDRKLPADMPRTGSNPSGIAGRAAGLVPACLGSMQERMEGASIPLPAVSMLVAPLVR